MIRILQYIASWLLLLAAIPAFAAPQARINEIVVLDKGSFFSDGGIPQVDVVQGICSIEDNRTNYEPFFDSVVSVRVINSGRSAIRFSKFWYELALGGSKFRAALLPPSARFEVLPDKTGVQVLSLFLRADSGEKYLSINSTPISASLGPKTVTFFLEGRDGRGKRIRVKAATTVVVSNYDRCLS